MTLATISTQIIQNMRTTDGCCIFAATETMVVKCIPFYDLNFYDFG